jgi:diguanylate cyclase (GGDEF)-like protein
VPIRDAQGQPIGVLAGLANLSDPSLFGSIIDVPVGKSGWIAVNDGRYRLIIAINDPKRLLQPFPPMGVNRMLDRYADGYEGSGISINSQGREVLSSAKQIPGTGWFVQVVLPTSEAFEPIQDMKRRTYLLATAFTGLVAVLVWIAVRIVLRPLASSAQEIRSMAEGNTSLRELPVERNDEVGELLASFNTLFQQRKALEAELERQARTDALTGLPNRRYFLEVAASELARTARFGGELSVLILDLDHFKKVNDAHGHHAGDVALRHFAETCRAALREVDLVARFGGEEFVILLPETGTDAATDVAERLRQAVADMDVTVDENTVFRLTTSIGITTSTSPDDDIDTLLSLADSALYEAKAGGRNRVATRLRG